MQHACSRLCRLVRVLGLAIVCTLVLEIVLVLVPVRVTRVLVLVLRVPSARVLRVSCVSCVLCGSLVQCTLVVLVAEQLVSQLWLVAPLVVPHQHVKSVLCVHVRA